MQEEVIMLVIIKDSIIIFFSVLLWEYKIIKSFYNLAVSQNVKNNITI